MRGLTLPGWLNSAVGEDGELAGERIEGGADDVVAVGRRLAPLEAMVLKDGKPAEDLLGLPLEAARERQRLKYEARADEERRKREAAARREVENRITTLAASARVALGEEAETWLGRAHAELGGRSPAEAAALSDADYWSAVTKLRVEESRLRRLREIEALQERLKDAARSSSDPVRALLFLTSTNRSWENRRPIEHCVGEVSFQRILAAMVAAAKR